MYFEKAPIVNYVFNNTGEIGGYPMFEIVKKEVSKQEMLGGSADIGLSKFQNLVIPAGLVSFSNDYYKVGGSSEKITVKERQNEIIKEELFNKVFYMITKCPKKTHTKKLFEKIISKKTKKNLS